MPVAAKTSPHPSPFGIPHSAFRIRRASAFTIIEILVVVGIIVILAAITVSVGSSVKTNAAIRSTHVTLKTLEGVMKDYLAAGNPEPTPPATWPYPTTTPPGSYAPTTPASDPINWVIALRANPEYSKKLDALPHGQDIAATPNVVILDAFGTPIRYVPYNSTTKKEGYFQSAGPDRLFTTESSPPTPAPLPDDLYSTDP
jgi:type II secretory pathway pseudopilin PulG